jgi:hypothetical protein
MEEFSDLGRSLAVAKESRFEQHPAFGGRESRFLAFADRRRQHHT